MKENKPLVIVLSRNYSNGLSVIRSLGMAGYPVDMIASAYKKGKSRIAACSKFVRNTVEVVSSKIAEDQESDDFMREILKYIGKEDCKPILFPTDDYTAAIIDRNRTRLEEHFRMPTVVGGGDGCMMAKMDKTFQAELARNAGLLTPQEWIISLREKVVIPQDMVYPCFCKPIESVTGYKKEMARCNTEQELAEHLEKLRSAFADRSILVQEFLEIDSEIDLSGVCLDQEIIIPGIIRKWNVGKHSRGVTLAGKVVPFDELGDLQGKIVEMLRHYRYVGMFDMELNIVGDRIYFGEVNLRSGGPNFVYYLCGVNLPALFVKDICGETHTREETEMTGFGKSFLVEKVAWEDYLNGYMTRQELEDRIAAADMTLLEFAEDPAPGRQFRLEMKLSRWLRKLRKAKRNLGKTLRKMKRDILKWPIVQKLRKAKHFLLGYPQSRKCNRRNPYAESPRVLVAGRNFSSNLCMARSVGKAGYEVESLRIFQTKPKLREVLRKMHPEAYSKYIKAYHVCISNRNSKNIVRKLIQIADPYRKMLLIPCDDLVANIADEHYEELKEYYVLPNAEGTQGRVAYLMSKEAQKELALAAGLPIINSCMIRAKKGHFRIPETVKYPCFVKPNVSKNSSKSHMRRCNSEKELRDLLTEYSAKKEVEMLVEDFIEIKTEYAILGLSTKEGVVSPGYFAAEEGGHDAHRGVAMIGRIVDTKEQQKLIDDITAFVASLNFDGLFDVDLILSQDGKMYFTELNLRYGASGYAVTESGVNLPGMFADYMLRGKPIDMDCKVVPGKRFISEKIMLDEYVAGYLTREEMMQKMDQVDIHFILDEADPKPYRYFKKYYPVASLVKAALGLKAKIKGTKE